MEYQLYRNQIGLSPTTHSSLDNTATLNHSIYIKIWPWVDHYVSGLYVVTISHISQSLSLGLLTLLQQTTRIPIIQKVLYYTSLLICSKCLYDYYFKIFFTSHRLTFHLSLTLLFTIANHSYLALEDGSPIMMLIINPLFFGPCVPKKRANHIQADYLPLYLFN